MVKWSSEVLSRRFRDGKSSPGLFCLSRTTSDNREDATATSELMLMLKVSVDGCPAV
ncbi:hypothetical protein D3C87_1822580 [compost metagenome]